MNVNTNAWNRLRYDLYAPFYDAVVARPFVGARARSVAALGLRSGDRVLVVGCGTGLDFPHLPPGVRLAAGDLAPAMVRRAARRAAALGFDGADVRVLDAHRLPYADGAFDAVVLHLLLAVVPDPFAAAAEAARVVRPDGAVAVFDKFLPDGARPSPLRRLAGAVTTAFATDLNRPLGPLLAHAGLVLERRAPALLGGLFETALARKPA